MPSPLNSNLFLPFSEGFGQTYYRLIKEEAPEDIYLMMEV